MADPVQYPACFGPYLRYAISTEFRDFVPFDEGSKLFFLVEFTHGGPPTGFEGGMKEAGFEVQIGPADDDTFF